MRLTPLLVLFALAPLAQAQSLRADGPPARVADALAHPQWSPAGDALALSRPNYAGLWLVAPDGSGLRALSEAPGVAFGAAWSADGTALLVRTARTEGLRREHAVALLDAATGERTLLTDWRGHMPTLPRWSADGASALLLGENGTVETLPTGRTARLDAPDGPAFLHAEAGLVSARPGDVLAQVARPLGSAQLLNVTPSPDRRLVAFEAYGGGLHVARADGSGLVDLGPGERPTWSPDGQWVAFMRTEDDGHALLAADLWAARADGTETVRLTSAPGLEMNPSWAPDGERLAYDDGEAVYVLPLTRASE